MPEKILIHFFYSSSYDSQSLCKCITRTGIYVYKNVFPTLIDTFGITSDLIIVCLAVNRFSKVRELHVLRTEADESPKDGYLQCLIAFLLSLLAHAPLFWQYSVQETDHCWQSEQSAVTEKIIWDWYLIIFHASMRVIPTLFILILNLQMYFEIKRRMVERKKATLQHSLPNLQSRLSVISRAMSISENNTTTAEIVKKVIEKWKFKDVRKAAWKMTQRSTLLWIVVTHLLLTLPANILYMITLTYKLSTHLETTYNFIYALYVIGHTINHALYCMTNKQVQQETGRIVTNCKNLYWTKINS